MIMPEDKPIEVVEEVVVRVPMSGAAMKQRLDEIKKEKELKQQGKNK
jgi:hypothetical protein